MDLGTAAPLGLILEIISSSDDFILLRNPSPRHIDFLNRWFLPKGAPTKTFFKSDRKRAPVMVTVKEQKRQRKVHTVHRVHIVFSKAAPLLLQDFKKSMMEFTLVLQYWLRNAASYDNNFIDSRNNGSYDNFKKTGSNSYRNTDSGNSRNTGSGKYRYGGESCNNFRSTDYGNSGNSAQ
jgi:hypothetical protein